MRREEVRENIEREVKSACARNRGRNVGAERQKRQADRETHSVYQIGTLPSSPSQQCCLPFFIGALFHGCDGCDVRAQLEAALPDRGDQDLNLPSDRNFHK